MLMLCVVVVVVVVVVVFFCFLRCVAVFLWGGLVGLYDRMCKC